MSRPSQAFHEIAGRSRRELERLLVLGQTPSLDALAGYEYRGLNCGEASRVLRIQKFIKGFAVAANGALGFNCRAEQNGLDDDWRALPDDAHPRRLGFFGIRSVDPGARDSAYLHALLLDYGAESRGRWDPVGALRDYVVRVTPGSDDLLLGKVYLATGPARVPLGFFLLERHRPFESDAALLRRLEP